MSDPDGRDLPRFRFDDFDQAWEWGPSWRHGKSVAALSLATMSRSDLAEWTADWSVVYAAAAGEHFREIVPAAGFWGDLWELHDDLLSAYAATTKPPEGT